MHLREFSFVEKLSSQAGAPKRLSQTLVPPTFDTVIDDIAIGGLMDDPFFLASIGSKTLGIVRSQFTRIIDLWRESLDESNNSSTVLCTVLNLSSNVDSLGIFIYKEILLFYLESTGHGLKILEDKTLIHEAVINLSSFNIRETVWTYLRKVEEEIVESPSKIIDDSPQILSWHGLHRHQSDINSSLTLLVQSFHARIEPFLFDLCKDLNRDISLIDYSCIRFIGGLSLFRIAAIRLIPIVPSDFYRLEHPIASQKQLYSRNASYTCELLDQMGTPLSNALIQNNLSSSCYLLLSLFFPNLSTRRLLYLHLNEPIQLFLCAVEISLRQWFWHKLFNAFAIYCVDRKKDIKSKDFDAFLSNFMMTEFRVPSEWSDSKNEFPTGFLGQLMHFILESPYLTLRWARLVICHFGNNHSSLYEIRTRTIYKALVFEYIRGRLECHELLLSIIASCLTKANNLLMNAISWELEMKLEFFESMSITLQEALKMRPQYRLPDIMTEQLSNLFESGEILCRFPSSDLHSVLVIETKRCPESLLKLPTNIMIKLLHAYGYDNTRNSIGLMSRPSLQELEACRLRPMLWFELFSIIKRRQKLGFDSLNLLMDPASGLSWVASPFPQFEMTKVSLCITSKHVVDMSCLQSSLVMADPSSYCKYWYDVHTSTCASKDLAPTYVQKLLGYTSGYGIAK